MTVLCCHRLCLFDEGAKAIAGGLRTAVIGSVGHDLKGALDKTRCSLRPIFRFGES